MSEELLTYRTEELAGDHNRVVTVVANDIGLEVDESFTIPWEFIEEAQVIIRARKMLEANTR